MLIINADDFGLNQNVNRAIVKTFEQGLCSSTTLMADMPGFEEACCLAHEHRLLSHVGIHLVMKGGAPLTEAIKRFPRFCDRDGLLATSEFSPYFTLEASEREVLAGEIRAQIARCRSNGILLTHLDSHFHLHTRWAILAVVLAVAQSEHIHFARIARNCGPGFSFKKRIYKSVVNLRIRIGNFSRTKYFCGLDDALFLEGADSLKRRRESLELMLHPVLHGGRILTNDGSHEPLETLINSLELPDEAVSYSGARYG